LGRVEKLIITCLALVLVFSTSFSQESVFAQTKGPRTEDIIIRFYTDVEAAYAALKAGDIDMVAHEILSDLYSDAIEDPNIVIGPVGDLGLYHFEINNNYTCSPLFPGLRSPTNFLNFRKGLAFCVDKDIVVDTFCGGFADRIDQPIPYALRGWRNTSYWYEDGTYPYEFNLILAAAAFDAAGFVQGTDANPDYNPGSPGSAEYLRIHPDTGVTVGLLEVCSRSDDGRRLEAGRALCDQLRLVGVPVNQVEASAAVLYPKVMDNFEYHVYTGGWGSSRSPMFYLRWFYNPPNPPIGVDRYGFPNYPILEALLEGAHFPQDHDEYVDYIRKFLGYIVEKCITITLFSARSFWAWSNDLLGVVNAEVIGPINSYTTMNAYKVSGEPIRYGLVHPPNAMNKIYSTDYYDYQCLDRMDLYSSIETPPYDQSVKQPAYIINWTADSWTDPDDTWVKSKITQTFRDDAWFVEPVTGNQLEHVNMTHHYASIWYEYQLPNAWNNDDVIDIKTLRITGPHTIEIYWTWSNFWFTYLGSTSIKSFNWWSNGNLSQTVTETLTSDGSGWLSCTEPVFYVLSAESGGSPLVLGTDYDIYRDPDGPHNADVRVINPAYLGAPVDITYLATNDASGYTPGSLPWQDAFEGAGMYYAVDFVPGIGGYLMLKRNPFYPMETPPLGEVDFVKKASGCYKIDIFDVVRSVSAYGSQGISVPDSNWFPGADLAYPGGQIDIFDIVTIVSNYGREWDCYP